jgi:hypothetical protein
MPKPKKTKDEKEVLYQETAEAKPVSLEQFDPALPESKQRHLRS